MNSYWEMVIKAGTLIVVAVSTALAIKVYYRSKKAELENSLFKSRLDAIGNIQMEITIFLQQIDKAKLFLKNAGQNDSKKLFELSFSFDDHIYKCEASIVKYAAYFSDKTASALTKFANHFYEHHTGITQDFKEGLYRYEQFIQKEARDIVDMMRKEAGIEDIHQSLANRFRKENIKIPKYS